MFKIYIYAKRTFLIFALILQLAYPRSMQSIRRVVRRGVVARKPVALQHNTIRNSPAVIQNNTTSTANVTSTKPVAEQASNINTTPAMKQKDKELPRELSIDSVLENPVEFGDKEVDVEINALIKELNKNKTFSENQDFRNALFALKMQWSEIPAENKPAICNNLKMYLVSNPASQKLNKSAIRNKNRFSLIINAVGAVCTVKTLLSLKDELMDHDTCAFTKSGAKTYQKVLLVSKIASSVLHGVPSIIELAKSIKTEIGGNKKLCVSARQGKARAAISAVLNGVTGGCSVIDAYRDEKNQGLFSRALMAGSGLYSIYGCLTQALSLAKNSKA